MVAISYRNGVSISEIVVYVPALAIAILLVIRHGRRSGWFFLIVFSLVRTIGPCLELAGTMGGHIRISLITGSSILQNIGLSPLMMTALTFLSRVTTGISLTLQGQSSVPTTVHLRVIQVIITAGLILGIVGGVKASQELEKTGRYVPLPEGKAAVALFLIVYILIVLVTVLIACNRSQAEAEEKSLLLAVALSLPFLLVRNIYSALSSFDSETLPDFNQVSGSVLVWLGMAVIIEMVVVLIYEGVGFALNVPEGHDSSPSWGAESGAVDMLGRLTAKIFVGCGRTIMGSRIAAALTTSTAIVMRRWRGQGVNPFGNNIGESIWF